METCDVLIVGAGPTGLLLANKLGRRGMACIVIDAEAHPPTQSLAIGIMPPSLEILRGIDLDREFVRQGLPVTRGYVHEEGRVLGCVRFESIRSRYPFVLSLPQRATIRILEDGLDSRPQVELRRGVRLLDCREQGDRVVATLATREGIKEIGAGYLVGCDGHRSSVRALAKIPAVTHRYRPRFAMADFPDRTDLGPEGHLFFSSRGSVESFPMPGNLRRWIVLVEESHRSEQDIDVIRMHVHDRTGYDLSGQEALWHSPFTPKWLLCTRFHQDRILLAGDAAHVMSPIGGQGMNTGFADAELLSEVLARVHRLGESADAHFRVYTEIRRRAFRTAAARAARGMWLGTRTGRLASRTRAWFIREVLLRPPIKQRLAPYFAMLTIPRPALGPRYVRGRPLGQAGSLEVRKMTPLTTAASNVETVPPLRPRNGLSLDEHLRVPELKRAYNERLFTRVAGKYGFVTSALSLGRDQAWKKRLVSALPETTHPVCVDLACGTGDITALLAERYPAGQVHGVDLTPAMLELARSRCLAGVEFSRQDMCRLSFRDESVDIVTGGYALRNAPDLQDALAEIRRILKPGGTAAFLDFSKPAATVPGALGYLVLKGWGSFWGLVLHRNPEVYAYIAETLRRYPDRVALHRIFGKTGLEVVSSHLLYLGMLEVVLLRKE